MNNLLYYNKEISKYQLKKVTPHYWGFKEGSFVYYMIAPPWVKTLIVSEALLNFQNDVVNCTGFGVSGAVGSQKDSQESISELTKTFSSSDQHYVDRVAQRIKTTAEERKPLLYSRDIKIGGS
jgi:hypothetical protein